MDGAWALYEAWVPLQQGVIDAALVYALRALDPGQPHEILALQLDPYYLAPLWPDPVSLAALQARALIDAGKATEAEFAAIASRSREGRPVEPQGPGQQIDVPADVLLEDEYVVSPLRRHALPPVTDGAAAIVLAAGDSPTRWGEEPAWITGFDHRMETHALGPATSPPPRPRPKPPRWPVWPTAPSTWPRSMPRSHLRRSSARGPRASTTTVTINPSGGPLAANPLMSAGLIRIGEAAAAHLARARPPGRWRTPHRARACNRISSASWRVRDGRALCSHRSGPDPPQGQAGRRVHRRPGPGGGRHGPGRRRPHLVGHRRRGHRQGPRHVRGEHDAGALPGPGARRRGQTHVPPTPPDRWAGRRLWSPPTW